MSNYNSVTVKVTLSKVDELNCFKGNIGGTPERRGGAHMGLPKRIDTILNWTDELNILHFVWMLVMFQARPSSDMAAFREHFAKAKHIVVLTGAGVSAESGVPTFRGAGGFWRQHQAQVRWDKMTLLSQLRNDNMVLID